ncbi:WYL domain-containing protein [Flavobacterium sp. XS2P12]|uniref:WYL domain-containing protein n=1 Tax=Flavobacterium melibiosi TaxID=3398734 RepID=UPI003A86FEE4
MTPLFNAIINKSVITVKYEPFNTPEYKVTFHPYFLKQYNNRWFVFGYNEFNQNQHWNLALDRINGDIEKSNEKYREDTTDWIEFFDDIIGVSKDPNRQVEEVKLVFSKEQAPYIDTKPLHWSQKTKLLEDGSLEVRIKVMLNYELEMRILSFGEKVKVLAPDSLVIQIKERIQKQLNNY